MSIHQHSNHDAMHLAMGNISEIQETPDVMPESPTGDPLTGEGDATPEETRVLQESRKAVQRAKDVLSLYDADHINDIKAKQRSHMLLNKEVDFVKVCGMLCLAHH